MFSLTSEVCIAIVQFFDDYVASRSCFGKYKVMQFFNFVACVLMSYAFMINGKEKEYDV